MDKIRNLKRKTVTGNEAVPGLFENIFGLGSIYSFLSGTLYHFHVQKFHYRYSSTMYEEKFKNTHLGISLLMKYKKPIKSEILFLGCFQ